MNIQIKPNELLDEELEELPNYSCRGRILVKVIWNGMRPGELYRGSSQWDFEVLDYDGDTSIMWMSEGIGIEWFLKDDVTFPEEGTYLLTNVYGHYTRGDGWSSDDDEEWYCDDPMKTDQNELDQNTRVWENYIREINPIMAPPALNPACVHHAYLVWCNNN